MELVSIVVSAIAGGAVVALGFYVKRRREHRIIGKAFADGLASFTEKPSTADNGRGSQVLAEHLTIIPDRYCERCDEPRGGRLCPLCGKETIEIPPEVLAEEIEAHRPKGSES